MMISTLGKRVLKEVPAKLNMVRKVDYATRKRAVLSATINRYIKEPLPISSEDIGREFGLSSATIRNIFADLEEAGYLTHPYTSAGRVPTNKGYRYYVDFLLSQMELLDDEKSRIVTEYKNKTGRLEDLLEKTSEVASAATHYTSIVSFFDWEDKIFYKGVSLILEQPEFQDIARMRMIIKMIEEKEELLNIINRQCGDAVRIYIGEELGMPKINNCSLAVSSYKVKKRPAGRVAILGPARMEYEHIIPALEYISEVLSDFLDD